MKNLGIFLVLLCALWLVDFLFENKQTADFKFMSVQHTNICRAVAAIIIILQHVAGGFGIRYLTPLGGIGVAIFLILSGYDLNESYKKKKSGGGLEDQNNPSSDTICNRFDCCDNYAVLNQN